MFRDSRVFLKQFFAQYHTTGSVLPSSRSLAKALCRYVPDQHGAAAAGPREILEVGPGTGAVTAELVRALRPTDRLTLVELNQDFVRHFKQYRSKRKLFMDPWKRYPASGALECSFPDSP